MLAQAGSDAMTSLFATAKDTMHTLGLARLTDGVGTAVHATMGELSGAVAAPILRIHGYEHACQGGISFPVKVLSESQLALRTYVFDDSRTVITVPDLRKQVDILASTFTHTTLPVESVFYRDGYADVRVVVPVPVKTPRSTSFTVHSIVDAPPSRRTAPGLAILANADGVGYSSEETVFEAPVTQQSAGPTEVAGGWAELLCHNTACITEAAARFAVCCTPLASARRIASATVGAGKLRVVHMRVPIAIHCKLIKLAQSTVFGTEKRVPAFLFGKPAAMVAMFVEDLRERKLPPPTMSEEACMTQIVMTVLMAMTVEASLNGPSVYELLTVESSVPFPKSGEGDKISDLIDQHAGLMAERYGDMENALPLRPASDVTGTLPADGLSAHLDEHELSVWVQRAHDPKAGAVITGPNLFGKAAPLDTKHPVSMISGVCRHFCDVSVTLDAGGSAGDATYEFVLRKGPRSIDLSSLQAVLCDLADLQIKRGKWCALEGLVNMVIGDNGPGSMSVEAFEEALRVDGIRNHAGDEEVATFMGNCFNKSGEDGDRARFVTMPGIAGRESLHQARTAPVIKSFEEVHKGAFSHCHIKGQNDSAKRAHFGEMLANCPKDWVGLSYDKKANDRCWTETHWATMCEFYLKCAKAFWWEDFLALFNLTPNELKSHTELRLKHLFGVFMFKAYMILLLSGIGPTGFFNRTMSEAEEGLLVREIWGEVAYQRWLKQRRKAPAARNLYWDDSTWAYGTKRTHAFGPDNNVCATNEGDDKTMLARLVIQGEVEGTTVKVTADELNELIVACAGDKAGFAYELARVPNQAGNCGHKAILEFCSSVIGVGRNPNPTTSVAYIVPKPMKALGKIAWSASSAVNYTSDPETGLPNGVAQDAVYHQFCATRFFSIAIGNTDSPGVGKVLHNCGEMHWRALVAMHPKRLGSIQTLYDRRAPEARKLEEWEETTFTSLLELRRVSATKTLDRVFEPEDCYVAAVAWQMDVPALANKPMEQIIASLLTFDESACLWVPTMEGINRPERFFEAMELGCLGPELVKRTESKYRALIANLQKPVESPEEIVERVKAFLRPITKTKTAKSAFADAPAAGGTTGMDKPASAPAKEGDQDAHGWNLVTRRGAQPKTGVSEPKPKGKGKGKAKGQGKGKGKPTPGGKRGQQRAHGHPPAAGKGSK